MLESEQRRELYVFDMSVSGIEALIEKAPARAQNLLIEAGQAGVQHLAITY